MLTLQSENIEEIWLDQEAIAERIGDQREEANQGNNQVEVIEPAEETKLDQEEDSADLLVEVGYILDQNFVAKLPRRKKTATQNPLLAFTKIYILPILRPSMKNQKNMRLLHKNQP